MKKIRVYLIEGRCITLESWQIASGRRVLHISQRANYDFSKLFRRLVKPYKKISNQTALIKQIELDSTRVLEKETEMLIQIK